MTKLLTVLILTSMLGGCMSPIGSDPDPRECPRYFKQSNVMYNHSNLGI
jgi:hypothetical protein